MPKAGKKDHILQTVKRHGGLNDQIRAAVKLARNHPSLAIASI
jgi:hypothetical protein